MNSNNRGFDPSAYMMENLNPGIVRGIIAFKKRRKLFFPDFIDLFLLKTQQPQPNCGHFTKGK